ncbi:uncharacterized protein CcaverHIS019_0212740 [Cutaneotrichosporon cavernicola]|uniref:FUN14-domain-containing protein n=1 Tax=Cutaneotrichosporon cavernicola TaxID=279322 RepID=A0AA48IBS8_9TREE|nr:uncharacterized protein CcaverHIS019_0212740 [Cutaneotrichosporon cavernicola]BEI89912.1 hypothetical protein CcaverHIS019_0212740 [Cutaneotrichosporon cavernicola]BEI97683.1 hypothetical protein CcaverHIS631_0212720 [Cutaneotrichosporon cavernicola]BEJ05460.1 hypothetical protein CcaverHIS641_0212770 [Cutaneotrichosporon cavernicola]
MSLRPGLLPQLARIARPTVQKRGFHFLQETRAARPANPFKRVNDTHAVTRAAPARKNNSTLLYSIGLGLAGFALTTRTVRCDGTNIKPARAGPAELPIPQTAADPPAESIVSLPTLTFGALTGICAGVFVKKGFKLVAFLLGGVFVLLQYLQSKRYVTVDWNAVSKSYDGTFANTDENGQVVYPTAQGLLNGFIDFLTANFQQRATFVAGFLLGLRVG